MSKQLWYVQHWHKPSASPSASTICTAPSLCLLYSEAEEAQLAFIHHPGDTTGSQHGRITQGYPVQHKKPGNGPLGNPGTGIL